MDQPNIPQPTDDYVSEQPLYVEAAIWAACIAIPLLAGYLFASALSKFSQRNAAPAAAGPSREQVQVTVITRDGGNPPPEPQPVPAPGSERLVLRPLQVLPPTLSASPSGTQPPGQPVEPTGELVLPGPIQPVSLPLSASLEGEFTLFGPDLPQGGSDATGGAILAGPGTTADPQPLSPPVILPLANLQPAGMPAGQPPVHPRRYNLAQNDIRQVAALIVAEVLTEKASSAWLDDDPDEREQLEALLIQYNVEPYQTGTWMHTGDILLQIGYDNLLAKVKDLAQSFTQETGIPVLRLDPALSFKTDSGKGVIDFGLSAAAVSTDEAHLSEAPPETEPVKLPPLGTWQFAPTHLREQALYLAACQAFLAGVLKAVDHLISTTGNTVASILLHPSEPEDGKDEGVAVIYRPELKLGLPLEVAPVPSPAAETEPQPEKTGPQLVPLKAPGLLAV